MPPISQRFVISSTSISGNSPAPAPVLPVTAEQKAPEGGHGPASVTESQSHPSPGVSLAPTTGYTAKQQAARDREEDAVLSGVQNLIGLSVTLTDVIQLVRAEVKKLNDETDRAEKRLLLKELTGLLVSAGKVGASTSEALARVMAAGRLNTGQAGAITAMRHSCTVEHQHTDIGADEEQERRLNHLLDIHARARAHVPGTYVGEEAGIIDAEVSTEGEPNLGDIARPVSLTSLREGASVAEARGASQAEAEQRLRVALAERGMPATQIDRVVDRAKARCEQLARELSTVVDEVLAAPPGQASN